MVDKRSDPRTRYFAHGPGPERRGTGGRRALEARAQAQHRAHAAARGSRPARARRSAPEDARPGRSERTLVKRAELELAAARKGGAVISEHRLSNGMRVLLAERHTDPVVAVMVWYRVGSRNEREHEAGVSHFLEHMMFKGTEKFGKGEIDRLTTMLGGSNNAFTSCDHTAYWFELASDRWEKALEIESDRMQRLALESKEFDAERAVVLEELSMGLGRSLAKAADPGAEHAVPAPSVPAAVIGHADALKRLRVEEMRDYHRRFYHPGNATLVICGDIDAGEALEKAHAHFESIAAPQVPALADAFCPSEELEPGERRVSITWDDEGKRLCMAWPTVSVGTDDDHALDVICAVLTGGRLSRLHRKLVIEKELATTISAHNDTRVEAGVFWIFAECAQGAKPAELEAAIDAELERLGDELVPAKELARVRMLLESTEAYESETATDLAEQLGEFATDADWKLAIDSLARMLAVDSKRIRDCARRLLSKDRRVVGWCLPKKKKATTKPAARRGAKR
jgi:zinc protease